MLQEEFGEKKFFGKMEVPWSDFLVILYKTLNIPEIPDVRDIKVKCLEAVMAETTHTLRGTKVIRLETFGRILSLFGPLKTQVDKTPDYKMFLKIKSLLKEKWFHGDITGEEAETRLNAQPKPGYYLVRFSSRVPGCFTISYKSKDKQLLHVRVKYMPGDGYTFIGIGNKFYDDLSNLIRSESKKNYYWKDPCTGSKYQSLFANEKELQHLSSPGIKYETTFNSSSGNSSSGGSKEKKKKG